MSAKNSVENDKEIEWTTKEVAAYLHIPAKRIQRLCREEKIPHHRTTLRTLMGNERMVYSFYKTEIDQWKEERSRQGELNVSVVPANTENLRQCEKVSVLFCPAPECGKPFRPKRKGQKFCRMLCKFRAKNGKTHRRRQERLNYRLSVLNELGSGPKVSRQRKSKIRQALIANGNCLICGETVVPASVYCEKHANSAASAQPAQVARICENPSCGRQFRTRNTDQRFCSLSCDRSPGHRPRKIDS